MAIAAFWQSLSFKAAVVAYIVLFYVSVCIGHFREAIEDGNFAASNVEPPARPDDRKIVILPLPSWTVWKDDRREASAPRSYGAMKRP